MLKREKCGCLKRKRKGQSTVEYVILVAAVIAAIIWFVAGANSPFRLAFQNTLRTGTNKMLNFAGRLDSSYPNK